MANASKKHFGAGAQSKSSGEGAMTNTPEGVLGDNMVLSNRDKAARVKERGMDGKQIQTEQRHDHAANRIRSNDRGRQEG